MRVELVCFKCNASWAKRKPERTIVLLSMRQVIRFWSFWICHQEMWDLESIIFSHSIIPYARIVRYESRFWPGRCGLNTVRGGFFMVVEVG